MFSNPAYPTYQAFLALGVAALVVMLVMPLWIRLLKHEGIGQQVRADGRSATSSSRAPPRWAASSS